jgi:hypothetical protein
LKWLFKTRGRGREVPGEEFHVGGRTNFNFFYEKNIINTVTTIQLVKYNCDKS